MEAARSLGLSRTTLHAKLRKNGIPVQPDDRGLCRCRFRTSAKRGR
ncbi:helix-turn-helix domain-containing protein [Azospirillum palustre]|nr:helix-turn-helix domain-containing protein [Azospirillum palustre]